MVFAFTPAAKTALKYKTNPDPAPASDQKQYTLTFNLPTSKIVTRHAYNPEKLYPDSKNHAVLSSHRDSLVTYRDRFVAVLRRVTLTKLYRRAVSSHTIDRGIED